jgi:nitroreductase
VWGGLKAIAFRPFFCSLMDSAGPLSSSLKHGESFMHAQFLKPDQWLQSLQWRYATKRFDPSRRIDSETWQAMERSMILTPSSFGLQPWKFVVIDSQALKDQLPAISWGQSQPKDCSHMVVFASLRELTPEYVDHFLQELARIRSTSIENLAGYRKVILGFLEGTRGEHSVWSAHQAYIALGQLMATSAALGIDACPMEGIEPTKYDALLGLADSPYATRVACALGYRHADDGYAKNPKVRFASEDVIVRM